MKNTDNNGSHKMRSGEVPPSPSNPQTERYARELATTKVMLRTSQERVKALEKALDSRREDEKITDHAIKALGEELGKRNQWIRQMNEILGYDNSDGSSEWNAHEVARDRVREAEAGVWAIRFLAFAANNLARRHNQNRRPEIKALNIPPFEQVLAWAESMTEDLITAEQALAEGATVTFLADDPSEYAILRELCAKFLPKATVMGAPGEQQQGQQQEQQAEPEKTLNTRVCELCGQVHN